MNNFIKITTYLEELTSYLDYLVCSYFHYLMAELALQ